MTEWSQKRSFLVTSFLFVVMMLSFFVVGIGQFSEQCPEHVQNIEQTDKWLYQPQCSDKNDVLLPDWQIQSRTWQNFRVVIRTCNKVGGTYEWFHWTVKLCWDLHLGVSMLRKCLLALCWMSARCWCFCFTGRDLLFYCGGLFSCSLCHCLIMVLVYYEATGYQLVLF